MVQRKKHSEVNFKSLIMQDVMSPSIVENLHVDIYSDKVSFEIHYA